MCFTIAMTSRFTNAEPLYSEALSVREKTLGAGHPDVAIMLNKLAMLYDCQGQYAAAEPLLKRALAIREKALDPENPAVATSLNSLAALYDDQGQYAAAEPLCKRALTIREKAFGLDSPNAAYVLNCIALLYYKKGQYAEAEPLFKCALAIYEQYFRPEHPAVANVLINLAGLYRTQGQYAQAELLYMRALETLERASDVAGGEDYAGDLRSKQQDVVGDFLNTLMHNAASNATTSVERAFWAMELVRSRSFLDMVLRSAAARQSGLSPADAQRDSDINAAMRVLEGKIAAADIGTVSAIEERLSDLRVQRHALDQEFATNYPRYMAMRKPARMDVAEAQRVLASNEVMIADWDGSNNVFACAIGKTNFVFSAVEKNASFGISVGNYADFQACEKTHCDCWWGKDADWAWGVADGVQKIPPRLPVLPLQKGDCSDPWRYCARPSLPFVKGVPRLAGGGILPKGVPERRIDCQAAHWCALCAAGRVAYFERGFGFNAATPCIFPQKSLKSQMNSNTFENVLSTVMSAFSPAGTTNDCGAYKTAALRLYDLLLAPLMSNAWVRDAEMTYIVPHGVLCALPFEALVCSTNGTSWRDLDYVFKKMRLAYVPSAMVLRAIRQDEAAGRYVSPARQPAVLFGDPIYETNQLEVGVGTRGLALNRGAQETLPVIADLNKTEAKSALRAVRQERDGTYGLKALTNTHEQVESIGAMLYGQSFARHTHVLERAQESRVKRMSKDGTAKNYQYLHFATHGLLGSKTTGLSEPCLALSLYGDPTEDGLLKMSEIFGLELDADMVILSACNTGVVQGDESRMDGLSGLSRAFFYAGTPRLTVTLWSIADEGTPEFMKTYYAYLKQRGKGMHTLDALNAAKRAMLARPDGKYAHPFFWAPFVLVGEWR